MASSCASHRQNSINEKTESAALSEAVDGFGPDDGVREAAERDEASPLLSRENRVGSDDGLANCQHQRNSRDLSPAKRIQNSLPQTRTTEAPELKAPRTDLLYHTHNETLGSLG